MLSLLALVWIGGSSWAQEIVFTNLAATITNLQGRVYTNITLIKATPKGLVWRREGMGFLNYTNVNPAVLEALGVPTNWVKQANVRAATRAAAEQARAHSQTVTNGNVEVNLNNVDCERSLEGAFWGRGQNYLRVTVLVYNTDSKRKINFTTWQGTATLSDEHGNSYKAVEPRSRSPYDGQPAENASIYPGSAYGDAVCFEPPVAAAQRLFLELPATNFGGLGYVRFEIPVSRIQRNVLR